MKHLIVDISGHGFGHLAQISSVINHLNEINDQIQITVRSSLSENLVRTKIHGNFQYISHELDKGMMMHDAMRVDASASYDWYNTFHQNFAAHVDIQRQQLEHIAPDLILADVPYLSLEAAHAAGIPSLALCSLNWADIFYPYCKEYTGARGIYEQISQAYSRAGLFLCPTPSMDMPAISNTHAIAPIALKGRRCREALLQTIRANEHTRFILVSLGGIDTDLDINTLPVLENIQWIMPERTKANRPDMHNPADFALPYIDILASVDLMITKTGYGAQVEATSHQIPIICISRPEWPEQANLFAWSKEHGYFAEITRQEFGSKKFISLVHDMLAQAWEKPPVNANGAGQAAEIVLSTLLKDN